MNPQIEERIEIIKSLNTTPGKADQSIDKRIRSARIFGTANYAFTSIFLIFIIFITIFSMLDMGHFGEKWPKFGLAVSLIISMSIQAPFSVIDFLLSRHRKNLLNSDFSFDNQWNDTLNLQIDNLNSRRFKPYWIKIPALIISIVALIQAFMVLDDSGKFDFYWSYFKFPVLLVTILLLWYINRVIYLVWENIKSVEASANQD
jgi:hypothetical protein